MRDKLATTAILLAMLLFGAPVRAQELASSCIAVAGNETPAPTLAGLRPVAQEADEVEIIYVGHSAFRIRSPQGITIVTDFAGYAGAGPTPDVVTMNHAHQSHYTAFPDPAIKHVLRGWNETGFGPIKHREQIGDVLIRNVATDLYSYGVLVEENGNSIFIFEVAGLCLGHLGHLHHKLTAEHIAAIGRIDVLFAPVDGTYTLSLEGMAETAEQLRASVLIPMHYFSTFTLERFVAGLSEKFVTEVANSNSVTVSRRSLPVAPKVLVLTPY
jgi:L-ascorbate metabolism protein UlaG (beta-lactamase superfamily)